MGKIKSAYIVSESKVHFKRCSDCNRPLPERVNSIFREFCLFIHNHTYHSSGVGTFFDKIMNSICKECKSEVKI